MSTPQHDPEENLPDWLKALRQKQSEQAAQDAEAENAAASQAAPESEPDWLADIRRRHSSEDSTDSERALTDTQPNKPFRLESRRLEAPAFEASDEPEPEDASPVPDWLDASDEDAFDDDDQETSPAFSDEDIEPASELPSWLRGVPPAEDSTPSGAFYDNYENMQPLTPAEIENAGPLAGLSGVLPAEPEVAKIGKAPVFSTRLEVSEGQYRHAAVLQSLIANEAQPTPDTTASTRRPARLLNLLMAGMLVAAAFVPLMGGQMRSPRPEPEALPGGTAMFNAIDVLPANASVLVIFDVQPALYGELRAAANPVISHLLDRQARLIFVSTQPTGPGLVERLLQSDFAQVPLVASNDYVSLGYLPGGMAAVRSFASDPRQATLSAPAAFAQPWQRSSLQSIQTLDDFALVLLVVSEGEDARTWVEQATPELSKGLLVVSSAQAAPIVRAYLDTEPSQVEALVAGVSGGAHYERLRARDTLSVTYWDSYSYQLGAAVLVIVLGGLYGRLILAPTEKKA